MKFQRPVVWPLLLLTCVSSAPVPAAEPGRLPDHYAEVVLHVEGMI